MRGVILAAGRGSRLGDYNGGTPKCLLEVARRRLIDHQLETLAECGVAPVTVVVGYAADEVREVLGIRAHAVHNLRWEQTNSIYSYWLARDTFVDDVVVMNCDVLFHPEILARLLKEEGDAIAYDSGSGDAPEHMKVKVDDSGRLLDMSKTMSADDSCGENVGMLKFTKETAQVIAERAGKLIEQGQEQSWLGSAVREVAQEREIRAVNIAGLAWGEVDSAYDLDHVRRSVWPAIRRSRRPMHKLARLAAVPLLAGFVASLLGYTWLNSPFEPTSWDTLALEGVEQVQVSVRSRTQRWWLLPTGARAEVAVTGPESLRLESRLLHMPEGERTPYVIKVDVDGRVIDMFKHSGSVDARARHESVTVAKRKRDVLHIHDGPHTVGLSIVGIDESARAVVRVREPEVDIDDDIEPDPEPDED